MNTVSPTEVRATLQHFLENTTPEELRALLDTPESRVLARVGDQPLVQVGDVVQTFSVTPETLLGLSQTFSSHDAYDMLFGQLEASAANQELALAA